MRKQKEIIYNTTRQWNPGDEFILLGVINIINKLYEKHNPIIFNRNPDIRPSVGSVIRKKYTEPFSPSYRYYNEIMRLGFNDNSIKNDSDLSHVDLAVFSGTPEWANSRCINFYDHILKNNLPSIILGVGSIPDKIPKYIEEVIAKSLVFTVRDSDLLNFDLAKKYNAQYLPCPALFSVPENQEKTITKLKKIGLVFGVKRQEAVESNCLNDEISDYIRKTYCDLIESLSDEYEFLIICHYIDELVVAHKTFDKYNIPILYSYDSKDYIQIYSEFDCVISPRVHGCGISSSLGIPNINIAHDDRAATCNGFLSKQANINTSTEDLIRMIKSIEENISELNTEMKQHKHNIFNRYIALLTEPLNSLQKVSYKSESYQYFPIRYKRLPKNKISYYCYKILSNITLGTLKKNILKKKAYYKESNNIKIYVDELMATAEFFG